MYDKEYAVRACGRRTWRYRERSREMDDVRRAGDGEFAIRAVGLEKRFGKTHALRGVDLAVPAGTVCALLGPNGAGKTTMARILTTLLRPDAGRAWVAGYDVAHATDQVRAHIGLAGQQAAVDELLTGRANLLLFGRLYHLPPREARRRADALLEQFGLTEAATRIVKTYSGGMRRRLDLAVSLVARPPILFLDEPTTGLDPRSRLDLWEALGALTASGVTILLTTQYLEEADRLADQIVVLADGRVIAAGAPEDLKAQAGAGRKDIVVRDASQLTAAAEALRQATGAELSVTPEARRITLAGDGGTKTLAAAVHALDMAGVAADDIALRQPTLDEVFLRLTQPLAYEAV
jgi:ABC-2 type transport system ATP-binding protein